MAKCDGECEKADPDALKFFKIDEAGLRNGSPAPGLWATDDLRANNLTWTVTVPASIAPGNYVLRHELIALHSADKLYGAQNYPQCINLEVTGSGTENPAGIPATEFYTPTDPGISLSIYYPALENYTIPGPPLFSGAQTGGNTPSPASSSYAPVSPSTVDSTEPTSAPEYASSVVSPMEPSMTTTPFYQNSATAADEQTSTTTTQTTTTMTTTVEPGSTPTDMSYPSSEVEAVPISSTEVSPMPSETEGYGYPSSEVGAVPTSSAEAIPTIPETDDYAFPTIVKEYGSEVTPPPSEPSPSSPAATSPTDAVPSPVETSTTPTASDSAEDSGNDMPVTKSLEEFIEWLKKLLEKYFNADGSRKHARDLAVM
jgi:lytic cellulose monooxygenase (C1-hydroxylating)